MKLTRDTILRVAILLVVELVYTLLILLLGLYGIVSRRIAITHLSK